MYQLFAPRTVQTGGARTEFPVRSRDRILMVMPLAKGWLGNVNLIFANRPSVAGVVLQTPLSLIN